METVKNYRDLRVWQMAMEITSVVYGIARRLPAEETYALAGQLRRAAVSVAANIAEGQAREHTKEFLRYLSVARGSLAEVDTLLEVALRADYVGSQEVQSVRGDLVHLRRSLHALCAALKDRQNSRGARQPSPVMAAMRP